MAVHKWTCQRQSGGIKCRAENQARLQKCSKCGKKKPPKKKLEHRAILELVTPEQSTEIFGDRCMICGNRRKNKRLARDHDHTSGKLRGILCYRCNTALRDYMTLDWMRKAVIYLEQAEEREWTEDGRPLLFSEERADTV